MKHLTVPSRPIMFYRRVWPGRLVWSRKIALTSAIAAAIVMDTAAIFVAAILADSYGVSVFGLDRPKLVYLVLPAYWLVVPLFQAYTPDVLRPAKGLGGTIIRPLGALILAFGIVFLAAFAFPPGGQFSNQETFYFLATAVLLMTFGRALTFAYVECLPHRLDKRVAVLSDGSLSVHAFPDKMVDIRSVCWKPTLNDPEFLEHVFRAFFGYDRIVIAFANRVDRLAWARVMQLTGLDAEMLEPDITGVAAIAIDQWDGQPTLVVSRGPLTLLERFTKRAFDITLTLAAAPIWILLIAVLSVLVRINSPGPALFAQERVGQNNRHYICYKLRTMRSETSDSAGHQLTERGDPRVTRLGAFLRKTSLDELPQLFNILRGEMSLVGPRPHALGATAEGKLYWDAIPGYWCRHSIKPGLTGLAQVRGYRGPTEQNRDLKLRVSADLEYINSWSIWLDIKIILQSIRVIVHPNAF